MYRFSRFFIDRPIFASVISVLIVVVGAIAFRTLPIAQYPDIVPPTIQIAAAYPGADAKTVSEVIATPIEKEVNGVENMLYISSQSTDAGTAVITVTFKLGTDLDIAQVQVQNRVARAEPKLPEVTRTTGVSVTKRSPDLSMVVNLYSPDESRSPLYVSNYASLNIKDELARVAGVGEITVFGARDYSMRVWLDPEAMAARQLSTDQVAAALREQNIQVAAGSIGQTPTAGPTGQQLSLITQGRLLNEEEFGGIIVTTGADGQITYLRDIARIELGAADYAQDSRLNGQPAVGVAVFQQPGSNQITTSHAIEKRMEELKAQFPAGVDYKIAYNTTPFIEESVKAVEHTLLEAVILVFFVVLLFLQNWRATLIPLLAVPVSIIGTLAVMAAFGFSLNNLSLFGLVLAIGIVVDDAIVVVENVERHLADGLSPKEATYKAMQEVAGALFAIALVLSSVFIPTAFVPGLTGEFFRQFALTIAVATLISALNSLTLSPALCALMLPKHGAKPDWFTRLINFLFGWLFKAFNWLFDKGTALYGKTVGGLIRLSVIVLLLYGGLLGLTVITNNSVPQGFIPEQDKGYAITVINLPSGSSLQRTATAMEQMIQIAKETEGVANTVAIPGFDFLAGSSNPSAGAMFVVLDPFEERKGRPELGANAIIAHLNQRFAAIPDGFALALGPPPVNGLGSTGGFKMILEAPGETDPAAIARLVNQAAGKAMEDTGRIVMARSTFTADTPKIFLHVDREKAKAMQVPLSTVFGTLQAQLGSLYVNDFTYENTPFRVILMADAAARQTLDDVLRLQVRSNAGAMVPLSTLVRPEPVTTANRIFRYNLYPAADLMGNFAPGVSSGDGMKAVEAAVANAGLPSTVKSEWTELNLQQQLAGNSSLVVFGLATLFVFLVLAAQYESLTLPLAIILIVPMCILSSLLGLHLLGRDNNIFTQIGFVVLVGLACKNAILIIEVARQHVDSGMKPKDAAVLAAKQRLRPILMTSLAFGLGVVPLAIANGAGAEMRRALGIAVFYGMLGVTLFGIFLTPVFFYVIESLRLKMTRRKSKGPDDSSSHGGHPSSPTPPAAAVH